MEARPREACDLLGDDVDTRFRQHARQPPAGFTPRSEKCRHLSAQFPHDPGNVHAAATGFVARALTSELH